MSLSLLSQNFPNGMIGNLLSVAELSSKRLCHHPNDFLAQFRILKSPLLPLFRQSVRLVVEQRAQSLLFPQQSIILEAKTSYHPDTSLTLGACLMFRIV